MAWRWVVLALAAAWACGPALAAPKADKKEVPAACKKAGKDDKSKGKSKKSASKDDDDDDDDDEGVRFDLAGACAKLTGGVSYTYQQAKQSGARIPVIVNKNGTMSSGNVSNSVSANIGLETTRQTSLGEFKTTVAADWSKATDDGTQNGTVQVTGWSVGLGGLTVGYTGSLMSFWEGDFLSTASAPARAANTIVYEYKFDDRNKFSVGLESNLPTTPQTLTGLQSFEFSNPVYTARWRYESDDVTFHLSGLARRADFSKSPLVPLFPTTATERTGWAGSAGVRLPMNFIADDDEFNTQWTYAVDASSYLGISTDLTTYQNTVRSTGPTTGWSAVASFHHVWSEKFESNIFGSYVALRADLLPAKPEVQTLRTGINLFWKPLDKVKFGIEFGTVDMKLDPNGVLGVFNGVSGRAYIGYLSMGVEL
jgi:hypothetical protein